jgi:hypothetical protein
MFIRGSSSAICRDTVEGAGWEFGHMAVDDASRMALGEVLAR